MKRLLIIGLCAVLLLSFAGCTGDTPEQPTGGTTGATTVTTTVTTTAPTTTTEAPTTTTTTEMPTTTTKVPTTTTEIPTTTATQPPVTDTALQIGGPTFTLDGVTFEMGTSAAGLLAHLGEPKETYQTNEPVYGHAVTQYYYEHLVLETYWGKESEEVDFNQTDQQIIFSIYFTDARYAFDGVVVGDTVGKLDDTPTEKEPTLGYYGQGLFGGVNYRYMGQKANWFFFFSEEAEEYWYETQTVKPDMTVQYIVIRYKYY